MDSISSRVQSGYQDIPAADLSETKKVTQAAVNSAENEVVSKEAAETKTADTYGQKAVTNTMVGVANVKGTSGALKSGLSTGATGVKTVTTAQAAEGVNPKVLQQAASQLGAWLNVDKAMSPAAYNNAIKDLDAKSGFFGQAINIATLQAAEIDKKMAEVTRMEPVDQCQLEQLTALRQMADGIITLYTHLGAASSPKEAERTKDIQNLFTDLASLQDSLARLDPAIVGEQTCAAMAESLQKMSELAFAFPTMRPDPNCATPSRQLGVFFLTTFRRLQQINDGQRKRASETADMTGALKTYENDSKDCCQRMVAFSNIRQKALADGITDPAVLQGMLQEVIKGAPALKDSIGQFAVSYANLAAADIHHREAKAQLGEAQVALAQARDELAAAEDNLARAGGLIENAALLNQKDLYDGHKLSNMVKQMTGLDARGMHDYARDLQTEAGSHIEQFYNLRQEGTAKAERSQAEAQVAGQLLNTAEAAVNVVEAGPQAKYFQRETNSIHGHINGARIDLESINNDAVSVKENFAVLDGFATHLVAQQKLIESDLLNLDADISMVEVSEKAMEMSQNSINQGYGRITKDINNYIETHGLKVSDKLKSFIRDPQGFLAKNPDEAGNMNAELSELFEDHPDLAAQIGGTISSLKNDFQAARRDLEDKLRKAGHDPADAKYKSRLDMMENSLINGLMNKNPYLFSAFLANGGNNNSQVQSVIGWVNDIQQSMAGHMVGDVKIRQSNIDEFDANMRSNPNMASFKKHVDERMAEYGQPVSTDCISIFNSHTGTINSVNVYIFKKDGKYLALDPLTNNVYTAATKDGAMAALAADCKQVDGRVSYADEKGTVHSVKVALPKDSFVADVNMSLVGLAGGLLLLVPEPTMATKVAGAACISASAAYFINKGTTAIIEQVSHDNFDLSRPESRQALIDLTSGLLSFAGGATTAAAQASRATMQIGGRTITLLNNAGKLARAAKILSAADTTFSVGSSMGTFGENLYNIISDDNLSDEDKAIEISKQVGSLVPTIAGAL